jgi:hypothetical protein
VTSVAVALAGCGGGGSDDAKSAIKDYLNAFVSGDGAKACSLMTDQTRQQFVTQVKPITKTTDCAKAITALRTAAGPTVMNALKKTEIKDVKVNGNTATATLKSGSSASTTRLQKEGGQWKVTGLPGTQ